MTNPIKWRVLLSVFYLLLMALMFTHPVTGQTLDTSRDTPKIRLYVGTYTGSESRGIYRCDLDMRDGGLTRPELAGAAENPSFLAIRPNRQTLYAVSEVGDFNGTSGGAVSAFSISSRDGNLTLLNEQPSGGAAPCHLSLDRTGKHALVANYGGGSAAVLPIREGGELGPPTSVVQHEGSSVNPDRQAGPHAHSIHLDPQNRFAFVADLGLDKVMVYRFDASTGTLEPHEPRHISLAPGAGPRHFAFHPSGTWAFVINELQSTITTFKYDAERGALEQLGTVSTLPEGLEIANTTAEVVVHPSGRFLYGSNRGHDSIAIFQIDTGTGQLTPLGHKPSGGRTPRNFAIDPTGKYLLAANQESDSLVVHLIDRETGRLTPTGHEVHIPSPVCIRFFDPLSK